MDRVPKELGDFLDEKCGFAQVLADDIGATWRLMFKHPIKSLFVKTNYELHLISVTASVDMLHTIRSEIAFHSIAYDLFFELHRLCGFLVDFGNSLRVTVQLLEKKKNRQKVGLAEYKLAYKVMEDARHALVDAQSRYNAKMR